MDDVEAVRSGIETKPVAAPAAGERRYVVLVNARAGTVLEIGAAPLAQRLCKAFAAVDAACEVHVEPVPQLVERLTRMADPATVPVVVGGDGTVLALLPTLLERDLPFAVLPMGTMNLLARDLGLTGELEADVAALHRAPCRRIDLATLNGVPFHSVSGLGFAVTVASERERTRRWFPFSRVIATAVAAIRALVRNRPVDVEVEVAGQVERRRADAVLVTNNLFQGSPWRRPRLDEGLLEVHLLEAPTLLARSRAALALMTGEWRALRHLTSFTATSVTVRRDREGSTRVTQDGEIVRQPTPLSYAVRPAAAALLMVVPPPPDEATLTNPEAVGAVRVVG